MIPAVFTLRYDGVYLAPGDMGATYYFRFYSDGIVIVALSIGRLDEIKGWLNIERFRGVDHHSVGEYDVQDNHISFYTKNSLGMVRYSGKLVSEEDLYLRYKSEGTGNSGEHNSRFTAVDEWAVG